MAANLDQIVEQLSILTVIEAAELMRILFQRLHLKSFVKTTGGKGLHVVVPVAPRQEWPAAKRFARRVAEFMAAVAPASVPDADGAGDEADGEDDPAAPVTVAACLEPKMADTMLPKTLIFFSCLLLLSRSYLFSRISRDGLWSDFDA